MLIFLFLAYIYLGDFMDENIVNTNQLYTSTLLAQDIYYLNIKYLGGDILVFKYEDEFDFEKKEKYNKKDIYEAKIIKKQPYKFIMKRIDEDQVKIIELVGNKSTI